MLWSFLKEIKHSTLHLLFPHVCEGCGNDVLSKESSLCLQCLNALPLTAFEQHADNPIEKKFYGRLFLQHATAHYYFTKNSLMQKLVHAIKYNDKKDLAIQLGNIMGASMKKSAHFAVDMLVPLPLFRAREIKRGFNQSFLICQGIAQQMHLPIETDIITRSEFTATQTKKGRLERWKNMEGKFVLKNASAIKGKHVLLVDDVITTGATLESCGNELLNCEDVKLSIAALCYSYQ